MENKKLSKAEAGRMGSLKRMENIRKRYEESPKRCKHCNKPIPYEKKHTNHFCDRKCSTTYNNLKRGKKTKNCLNCGKEIDQKKKYCSRKCQHDYQYKKYIEDWKNWLVDGNSGQPGSSVSCHIKRYLREKYDNKCCECGWDKKHPLDNKCPLQVEHIDGNAMNNKEENLKLLCPNCHSLTLTFGARNRQSARKYRYKNK